MNLLSKKDILRVEDVATEIVAVPEWGGDVAVRGMTGVERDAFEAASMIEVAPNEFMPNRENARARLCAACIVDAHGERIFNENDVVKLGRKSGKALDRVFAVAVRLSGMRKSDVEEIAKNLNGGQSADSSSDSAAS